MARVLWTYPDKGLMTEVTGVRGECSVCGWAGPVHAASAAAVSRSSAQADLALHLLMLHGVRLLPGEGA